MLFKAIALLVVVIMMEHSVVYANVPSSQYERQIISANHNIRTDQIYLGIYTNTCYINGKSRIILSGFLSSLKMPLRKQNNTVYVPPFQTVIQNNPSYQAGLRVGDEILSYNGIEVNNERHLTLLISRTLIGTTARIRFLRKGQIYEVSIFPEVKYASGSLYKDVVAYKWNCSSILEVM